MAAGEPMKRARLLLLTGLFALLALPSCGGGTPDPCASVTGACVSVELDGPADQMTDFLRLHIVVAGVALPDQTTVPQMGTATGFP